MRAYHIHYREGFRKWVMQYVDSGQVYTANKQWPGLKEFIYVVDGLFLTVNCLHLELANSQDGITGPDYSRVLGYHT